MTLAYVQGRILAPGTLRGLKNPPRPHLQPISPPLPSPRLRDQLALRKNKQEHLLVAASLCCSLTPNKTLPEIRMWTLINFYLFKESKSPGQ